MTDQEIASFAASQVPDWNYHTNCGLYVHRGRVFVAGGIYILAPPPLNGAAGSSVILQNLPPELRPPTDTATLVMIDGDNSEPGYTNPFSGPAFLPTTVHPDGSWTFDGGNPWNPAGFGLGFNDLYVILSSASWPAADAEADTYTKHDITPFLACVETISTWFPTVNGGANQDAWRQIDGTYSIHGSRLHLDGHIEAGPSVIFWNPLVKIPLYMQPQVGQVITDFFTEVPMASGDRGGINVGANQMYLNPQHNRAFAFHEGDVIDMSGSGWPLAYTPPAPAAQVGAVGIGEPRQGLRRLPTWRRAKRP